MTKPESVEHGTVFDLDAAERELRLETAYERGGHVARTLVRTADLRILLVIMKGASRIAEHHARETASILVRSGRLRLTTPERTIELPAGQLLVLGAGLRHDVEATEDSAFVLTLGWLGES